MALIQIPNLDSVVVRGDDVTISGTVDGVPVTVHCWLSHLNTLSTKAAKAAYVAGLMKAAVPPASVTVDLTGTYTA